jgi:hypothetical protein
MAATMGWRKIFCFKSVVIYFSIFLCEKKLNFSPDPQTLRNMNDEPAHPLEFSDLPPEIRREVQSWLAPDAFWDQTSRHFALEEFGSWAKKLPEPTKWIVVRSHDWKQTFVQCYRFVTRFDPVHEFMVPRWVFNPPTEGKVTRLLPGTKASVKIDSDGWMKIGGLKLRCGFRIRDGAKYIRVVEILDEIFDSPIQLDEPMVITLTEDKLWIRKAECAKNRRPILGPEHMDVFLFGARHQWNRRHLVPACLVLEALLAWPRQEAEGEYIILNPF